MKEKNNKDSREVLQVLDIVNRYSKTFMLLDKYDSNDLDRIRLEKHIGRFFQENERLTKKGLTDSIKIDFPNLAENTINMYLSKLKKEGILSTPSRGIYELNKYASFEPVISNRLKRLSNRIKRKFPYITFCIWDTRWFNEFMLHQPFKHYGVLEVEKDAAESVFAFSN